MPVPRNAHLHARFVAVENGEPVKQGLYLPDEYSLLAAMSALADLNSPNPNVGYVARLRLAPLQDDLEGPKGRGASLAAETALAAELVALFWLCGGDLWVEAWDLLIADLRATAPEGRPNTCPPRDIQRPRPQARVKAAAQLAAYVFGVPCRGGLKGDTRPRVSPAALRVALSKGGAMAKAIGQSGVMRRRADAERGQRDPRWATAPWYSLPYTFWYLQAHSVVEQWPDPDGGALAL
jgi:hypothetical protein